MMRPLLLIALAVCGLTAIGLLPHQGATPAMAAVCSPARPHAAGTTNESILTAGGTRTYRLHVPASYTGSDAVPVIFNFHGLGSNAAEQESYSQFSTLADQPNGGFIVVYPQGIPGPAIPTNHFNAWQFIGGEPDDVGFTSQLLYALETQLCIDATRVYSTGMSNGAMMSTRIACSLSSQFAAVAPVAGWYYPADFTELNGYETCPDTRPVPVIAFHGTADDHVPFYGGVGSAGSFSVHYRLPLDNDTTDEDVTHSWAVHNNCTGGRQESQIDTEIRLVQYDGCDDGANLQLYIVDGGGHTWPGTVDVPGLGYTTHQIVATDLIWQFFQAYSLNPSTLPDTDGDGTPDAYDNDDDNDGCADTRELGSDQMLGGLRDPRNFWDFFDTPDPNGVRDHKIRVDDVTRIVNRYRTNDANGTATINRHSDPLSMPPAAGYHPAFDRSGGGGPHPWNLGPADGQVNVQDVTEVVNQYRNDCA